MRDVSDVTDVTEVIAREGQRGGRVRTRRRGTVGGNQVILET